MCMSNPVLLIRMQGQGAAHKLGAHPIFVPPSFPMRAGGGWKQPHCREGCCSLLQAIHLCEAPRSLLFQKLLCSSAHKHHFKAGGYQRCPCPHPPGTGTGSARAPFARTRAGCCVRPFHNPGDGKTNRSDSSKIKSF